MIDKTMEFVLGHTDFKTLGCGRTDAKVSADDYYVELFVNQKLDSKQFKEEVNRNLPPDIRVKSVQKVAPSFNIIQDVASKEYHYYFSSGEKAHPFNAPFMWTSIDTLDIAKMKEAAALFEGVHDFGWYAVQPSENTVLEREITCARIEESSKSFGYFRPEELSVFKVKSKGFMKYQVRMMMGALIDVGLGNMSLEEFRLTLTQKEANGQKKRIAPSSGLVLHQVVFN